MAREHLDVSIESLEKKPGILAMHINETVTVTEKVDGTKLTFIRNNAPWNIDPLKNWIVAYKSQIINAEDFDGLSHEDHTQINSHSNGYSQYKYVWDGIKRNHAHARNIPLNTELFIEFVMRKPTLTREYSSYHSLILIASSPTKYTIRSGMVYSTPSGFDVSNNASYANMLDINCARVLYHGPVKKLVTSVDASGMVKELQERFLNMPSEFGGKMEGVVFEFSDGVLAKLVQADQYDKGVRSLRKLATEPVDADAYYAKVRDHAVNHVTGMDPSGDFTQNVKSLSHAVYGGQDLNLDGNKHSINAKDDIFTLAKNLLTRKAPGNNGALFIGRMSPITTAHFKIIDDAIKTYDSVTVNLVKSKIDVRNPFPIELQMKMLKATFGDKVTIITGTTGNVGTILQKCTNMINVILAGTDRVDGYESQLKRRPDIRVVEIPRVDEVSGTMVRSFIASGDIDNFKKYTPNQIWHMFDELHKYIHASLNAS